MDRNRSAGQIVNAPLRLAPRRTTATSRTVRANVAQARTQTPTSITARTPAPTEAPLQKLLSRQEAAQLLGLSEKTLRNWSSSGQGPRWLKLGSAVRYRPADLQDWLAQAQMTTEYTMKAGL